jgi:hypothetical protein
MPGRQSLHGGQDQSGSYRFQPLAVVTQRDVTQGNRCRQAHLTVMAGCSGPFSLRHRLEWFIRTDLSGSERWAALWTALSASCRRRRTRDRLTVSWLVVPAAMRAGQDTRTAGRAGTADRLRLADTECLASRGRGAPTVRNVSEITTQVLPTPVKVHPLFRAARRAIGSERSSAPCVRERGLDHIYGDRLDDEAEPSHQPLL